MGNSLLIDDHSFWKNIRTKVLVEGQSVSSVAQWCPTLCNPIDCSTPGFPVHHHLPEFPQTHVHESVMPSNHLILCHPLLLLPSIFPNIKVFSNESALRIQWPKYWSFSFNISPSSEHPALISFRMDWLDQRNKTKKWVTKSSGKNSSPQGHL